MAGLINALDLRDKERELITPRVYLEHLCAWGHHFTETEKTREHRFGRKSKLFEIYKVD
jgi:hypothetical protein